MSHYVDLLNTYHSKAEIKKHYHIKLSTEVNNMAQQADKYKFQIYKQFNPDLKPLDFQTSHYKFPRLRLSSHSMPIETGRWTRVPRENRLCPNCNVLGDERHFLYECNEIDRTDLSDIPELHQLSDYSKLKILMDNLDEYL